MFYQFEKPDPEKIIEGARQAYGIKNPERINGFIGAFLADHKDVYITDKIARITERRQWLREFLDDCITRFYHDDWGFVTEEESWNNTETRYLAGSTDWMIARYEFKEIPGGIVFANLYDISLISLIEEDVSAVYEEQFRKCPYCKGSINERFLNELKYVGKRRL